MFLRRSFTGVNRIFNTRARLSFDAKTGAFENVSILSDGNAPPALNLAVVSDPASIPKLIEEKNGVLFEATLRHLSKSRKVWNGKNALEFLPLMTTEFVHSMNTELVYVLFNLSSMNINVDIKANRLLVLEMLNRLNAIDDVSNQQISTVLTSLSRMGLSAAKLKNHKTMNTFLLRVYKAIPSMTAREIVQTLQSLHSMDVTSDSFPASFNSSVITVLKKVYPEIQSKYKAGLLFSLGRLGFRHVPSDPEWLHLLHQLAEEAFDCPAFINVYLNQKPSTKLGSTKSIVAMGLSSMYLSFADFPSSLQEKLISCFATDNHSEFALLVAS